MVAVIASLFPVSSPKPHLVSSPKPQSRAKSIKTKSINSGGILVKANSRPRARTKVKWSIKHGFKSDDNPTSNFPKTIINQLPDWSMLLAAITTLFLAAKKQWMIFEWKTKRPDDSDRSGLGKTVHDGRVFSQRFSIRSFEIGADGTSSIGTLVNQLQETALNHSISVGFSGEGFGTSREMCKRNLLWIVTKMHVTVERYPTWGDVVQVDTWISPNGKNSTRRDWLFRDSKTGQILTRATSNFAMMNRETRRLSKIPDEVRAEIEHYYVDLPPVVNEDSRKLPKLEETNADYVCNGLTPKWSDLDLNQHVNHSKYISWILESTPEIEEKYELASIDLEYRRECRKDSVVKSLTKVLGSGNNGRVGYYNNVDFQHVLLFEGGVDGVNGDGIVKGRTKWRPKSIDQVLWKC